MSGCWQVDKIRGNCQFWYYHINWVILVSNGASCIYRRFWHILRIFFQYLYESRYFDHSCIILCVVPYASEKFGQIWTKMIEEAMMRLFLRKKSIKGRNFDRFKKSELILDTILLGRSISFSFPCDMNIIQLPHCSEKEIWKWSPILELFPNYCLLSRLRRMMTWLAHLITRDLDQDPDHVQVNSLSVYNSFLDDVASSQDYRRTVQKERGAMTPLNVSFLFSVWYKSYLKKT